MKLPDFKRIVDVNSIVLVVAVIISFSLIWNTVSVIERNFSLQQKVDDLEEEVAILQLENDNLKLNNEYYKTDDYLDLAAREKFNKVAAGEKVIVLPEFNQTDDGSDSSSEEVKSPQQNNIDQWLYFLFNRKP